MRALITLATLGIFTLSGCLVSQDTREAQITAPPTPPVVEQVAEVDERRPLSHPSQFDERWYTVRPRAEEGFYPNLPADWEPMDNPRYDAPEGEPLAGLRICVDAGHGGQLWGPTHGYTGGTRGVNSGHVEEEANLRIAYFLWDLLTQAGAEVVLTRTRPERMTGICEADSSTDEWIDNRREELHVRPAMAEAEGCDYFLSIHHNAPRDPGSQVNYTSVYYFDTTQYNDDYNADAYYQQRQHDEELNTERWQLALAIQEGLGEHLNLPIIQLPEEWAEHFGHGVPHGDFHVLRENSLPAVLVETSFMTNEAEDMRLNDPARAKQTAIGIFEGILTHFSANPIRSWNGRSAEVATGN